MRRVVPLAAAVVLALAATAQAKPASHVLALKLSIIQHGTVRTPHPPLGDVGDLFTTTLLLNNTTPALGKAAGASVGAMIFAYVLHGTCSTESCAGATADITATSRFPGGTVIASDNGIKLGHPPIVIPITKGTGAYKGATGEVTIGAAASPYNTYRIVLP